MGKVTTTGYEAERLDTIIARLQEGFRSIYGIYTDSPPMQTVSMPTTSVCRPQGFMCMTLL
nr:hypothetical protein [Xylella fastidiosa]